MIRTILCEDVVKANYLQTELFSDSVQVKVRNKSFNCTRTNHILTIEIKGAIKFFCSIFFSLIHKRVKTSKQPQGDNFKYNFSYKFDRILEKFHLQMIWFPPVLESPGKSWNFFCDQTVQKNDF